MLLVDGTLHSTMLFGFDALLTQTIILHYFRNFTFLRTPWVQRDYFHLYYTTLLPLMAF